MKLLSIGNSFSQDAHKFLHELALLSGFDLDITNLYVPGCSLEMHWDNVIHNNASYDLEINGNSTEEKTGILQALLSEKWDVITLQQVSPLAGMPASYDPYLTNLETFVKDTCPEAKIFFHQTWAYETDSTHSCFCNYGNDQKNMFNCIISTAAQKAGQIRAAILPVGAVIQYIRENIAEFDYQNGGLSLCRDGFHLTLNYGRYAAAATWLRILTGTPLAAHPFQDLDFTKTSKIISSVNKICASC